ncbi:substrate-binding domain-containing protein [Sphingomonas sp. H39-1-10]|uniref:molybdate ABC transporter substrate-binding protein n=1 Tax=Sphingomonas pollutisoli TaxID=3030829 RepID=UPI0023B9178C|nr:substrate-binding domain-containing protein [Sphingomonas pollutisoli]MDF0491345.1 substrate-binding domain-containing protein [Sphingomonas pollutisoli]
MARGKIRAALAALAITAALSTPAMAQDKQDQNVSDLGVSPPWQGGRNNDAADRGFGFTVADADNLADFHGSPMNPLLSLYVGGNYFFAMAPLVAAFEAKYPEYKGRLYWETIPPGLLVRQIKAGGTVTVGNMTWTVKPDVYLAGEKAVEKQLAAGLLAGPVVPYVTNTLAIMVPKGNPAEIKGLSDFGRPDVKLAMPNPEFEGIARQIQASLAKAGGDALATAVYKTKVADGSTQLTHIHHRQTPLWLMQGKAQAGVTWQSEVEFQKQVGHPIDGVDIPAADNTTAIYAGAVVKGAAHPEAARRWLDFIRSPDGLAIFERYGFKPYTPSAK